MGSIRATTAAKKLGISLSQISVLKKKGVLSGEHGYVDIDDLFDVYGEYRKSHDYGKDGGHVQPGRAKKKYADNGPNSQPLRQPGRVLTHNVPYDR